jgi:uncharacterized protein (DUF2235 family)
VKRLALFFDGTWNESSDHTNVFRLYLLTAEHDQGGVAQLRFYDPGVGTHWFDRLSGGAFGFGLHENIRRGYRWLMEHYEPGDQIFLFGFSRGAFTARSLAGLIARCGLLRPDSPMSYAQLFDRYQRGVDEVRPIYELIRDKHGAPPRDFEERVLLDHAVYQRNIIRMVGVWDTVGALGVPLGGIPGISRRTLWFHNTRLSRAIEHSYHALALDEQRAAYEPLPWTEFFAAEPRGGDADTRTVEQRWFSGAHADVGGGYRSDLLSIRPLAWMQDKARACGLAFRSVVRVSDDDLRQGLHDSYAEFLLGAYRAATLGKRFARTLLGDAQDKAARVSGDAGRVATVNERIDASVFARCALDRAYRPAALGAWAARKRVDLEALIADPQAQGGLSSAVTAPGVALRE